MAGLFSKKRCDFTEGNMVKLVIKFAVPIFITVLLNLMFNTVDSIMVGRFGGETPQDREAALAAVGSCASLIHLITTFFIGLSVGANVAVSYDIGAKNHAGVKNTIHTAVTFAAIGGVVVAVLGIIFVKPALIMMGTEEEVLKQAVPYMIAYMCGVPANIVYNYCSSILRSSGDTVRPMMFLTTSGVVNVCLNAVMIFVFKMGAVGVGIATGISFWVACFLIVRYMYKSRGVCRLCPRELRIDGKILKKILKIGVPAGVEDSLFALSNVLIQSSINSFGTVAMAGNAASKSIDQFLGVPTTAFAQSALTAVSQNCGAKKYDRVKKSIGVCAMLMVIVHLTIGISLLVFGRLLLGIFAPDNPEVVEYGMIRLRIMASSYFIAGLMSMGNSVLRGLGKSFISTVISLVGTCALRIAWVYTVVKIFNHFGVIFIAYPVTWFVTGAVIYIMIYITLKKIIKAYKYEKNAAEREEAVEAN